MSRKIINIFFILIFILQVLPIRQVGRMLFQASMVEELPEKESCKSTASFEDHIKHFLSPHNYISFFFNEDRQASYIHLSDTLPLLRASDVQTPPPDIS